VFTALGIGRETELNATILSDELLMTCGVNYCPEETILIEPEEPDNATGDFHQISFLKLRNPWAGVDVMITIFCGFFANFRRKNWRFSQKPMLNTFV
jgi:hypothetical protein